MKIAVSADIHFHAWSSEFASTLADGTNSRLADIMQAFRWMVEQAIVRKAELFVVAGDLFHSRKSIEVGVLSRVLPLLHELNNKLPIWVLDGNHDQSVTGDGASSVKALVGTVDRVLTQPQTVVHGDAKLAFLPWCDDTDLVRKYVEKLAKEKPDVLFAHLGISDAGVVPSDFEIPGHVKLADIQASRFGQVFLGHYHSTRELATNARYCGSPLQLTFGERDTVKGFYTYDTAKPKLKPQFVENTFSPKFHVVSNTEEVSALPKTDFVKAKIKKRSNREEWTDVQVDRPTIVFEVAPEVTDSTQRITSDPSNRRAILDEYVKLRAPKGNQDNYVSLGLKLLNEGT